MILLKSKRSNKILGKMGSNHEIKIEKRILVILVSLSLLFAVKIGTWYKASINMRLERNLWKDSVVENNNEKDDLKEEEEEFLSLLPASGLQMKVELYNIKASLLSEELIIDSMLKVIEESKMSLLSFHCFESFSSVDCFAILDNRSHFHIHTFKQNDDKCMVLVDVLCSSQVQLILVEEVLPMIEEHFANKLMNETISMENARWKVRLRNPTEEPGKIRNIFRGDLTQEFIGNPNPNYLNKRIFSVETPFQRLDVYDIVDPKFTPINKYLKSLSGDDSSYESLHPELYKPNRVVFLDGVSQSLGKGVEAYHEALVQPAMFVHDNPRRVAIIGGGEGATLREALKHESVQNVTMIDIDEEMCKASSVYLFPAWNGCDDFINSTTSCFDHPKAYVTYEDALAWFVDRFYSQTNEEQNEKFDVVIMDALDPQDTVEFANILYQDKVFWQSVYNGLSEDGVLIAQLGDAPENKDPADNFNSNRRRAGLVEVLREIGFYSSHSYEEPHSSFEDPWTFLCVCKTRKCHKKWYSNPAEVDIAIHTRIQRSKSGTPLLKYFDAATFARYQVPHKGVEVVYCHKQPTPIECQIANGFHHNTQIVSKNSFAIQADDNGLVNQVIVNSHIPKFSFIDVGNSIQFSSRTNQLISKYSNRMFGNSVLKDFVSLSIENVSRLASEDLYISSGIPSMLKHTSEKIANIASLEYVLSQSLAPTFYNPIISRHLSQFHLFVTMHNISEGDYIFPHTRC